MIKFFRHIRRSLINENKMGKYFKYAIGEILLVVIGILIALQINNWNEDNKRRQMELNLLSEMKDNLSADVLDLEFNIKNETANLISNKIILDQLENRLPFHDSLKPHYGKLPRATTFTKNLSAYTNLRNLGVSLISNDSLRRRITNLYEAQYNYIDKINERTTREFLWDELQPMLSDLIFIEQQMVSALPQDQNSLYKNQKFKEQLKFNIFIKNLLVNINSQLKQDILEVKDLIDKELDKEF